MRSQKQLQIKQLDRTLQGFIQALPAGIPDRGWIHTIRTSLNMTLDQLARKLNITKQGVMKMEERESNDSITLKSLMEIGDALDLRFVYGFAPKHGSLDKMITLKAEEVARKIVLRTHQTMVLENQSAGNGKINQAITDLAEEIKREMRKSLWD